MQHKELRARFKKKGDASKDLPLVHVFEYENNLDVLSVIDRALASATREYEGVRKANEDTGWCSEHCKSYNEALQCLRYGNPKLTQEYIDAIKDIEEFGDEDRSTYMDVVGYAYDMGSVVNGTPECCVNMDFPEPKKFLNIYVACAQPWYVDKKNINYRGVAIANLINTLLIKNYNLSIYFIYSANYDDYPLAHVFKASGQLLCMSEIAFYCSVEFFRMITLPLDGMVANDYKKYGQCQGKTPQALKEKMIEENAFFIPNLYDNDKFNPDNITNTPQKAQEHINNLFNAYCERGESEHLFKQRKRS